MQFRLSLPLVTTVSASGFKQGLSSILAGLTIAGAFSTVVFSSIASNSVSTALDPIKNAFVATPLYSGIVKVGEKLKDWGATIVGSKDAFANWVKEYLNPHGLKAGIAGLYQKLKVWTLIVYNWFKDKFWEFIKNIPAMVKDWDKLRLSLFKWGTFLGGGGGSALWAMFGSGENLGKLAELMGDPKFAEALGNISDLMDKNGDSFASMTQEQAEEIVQKILDNPEEANEIAKGLLEEQKEANKDKTEDQKTELGAEKISEAFGKQKGGNPQTPQQALGNMIASGLRKILDDKGSFRDSYDISREAMKEHIEIIKKEAERKNKSADSKKKLLAAIDKSEDKLVNALARLSAKAYSIISEAINPPKSNKEIDFKQFASIFEYLMQEEFTEEAKGDQKGTVVLKGIVNGSGK